MARKDPGARAPELPDEILKQAPSFDEKLVFVFEIIPVIPLIVAPGTTPPGEIVTPPQILKVITDSPEKPMPGAVKPGSPVLPYFMGQLPPIKLEGHNITHLSLDMQTHGFRGEMSFRVSDTRLLGDVQDKDRIAKVFRSQNILMLKLCLRPKRGDEQFPEPFTQEPVPQVVGAVPVPVTPPPPPQMAPPPIPHPAPPPQQQPRSPPQQNPLLQNLLKQIPQLQNPQLNNLLQNPQLNNLLQNPQLQNLLQQNPQLQNLLQQDPQLPPGKNSPFPSQFPVRPDIPLGGKMDPALAKLTELANSPLVQEALKYGAAAAVTALCASNPELIPVFIALGVAAKAGLIPPPMAGPAESAGAAVLATQPEVGMALAVVGAAGKAGLLPKELAPLAGAGGDLAADSNPEIAQISMIADFATKNGLQIPGGEQQNGNQQSGNQQSGNPQNGNPPSNPLSMLAQLADQSGLLPPGLLEGIAQNPGKALTAPPLSELTNLLKQVGPLAKQLSPTGLPDTGLPAGQQNPLAQNLPQQQGKPPIGTPTQQLQDLLIQALLQQQGMPPQQQPPQLPPQLPQQQPQQQQQQQQQLPNPPQPLPQDQVPAIGPVTLPPKLRPIIQPIPEMVGMPVLYEEGLPPMPPLVPIEMVINAVITERTIIEHTSFNAEDIIVSIREYTIEFCDPAQALWRRHFPLALYTQKSLKQVINANTNPIITVSAHGPQLSVAQEMIFLPLHPDNPSRERASFYDWLMWRLDEIQHEWQYDYSQNIYKIVPQPKRPEPFEIFAADIAEIITHRVEGRFYTESLMNDYTPAKANRPILNLDAVKGLRQDRLFHTQVPDLFDAEYLKRQGDFSQPHPAFILLFKRFPSRPFPPGVGVDFKLDPIDFPDHRFLIPPDAKTANRVARLCVELKTKETDVLPRFKGYSEGIFRCAVAAELQSGKDKDPRLPRYIEPRYPLDIEGMVHTDIGQPGEQIWQTYTDPTTAVVTLEVAIPLFKYQRVKVPFEPISQPGHFFFPPYRNERVLLSLYYDRAEVKRFLNWRIGAEMPMQTQGNHLKMGRDLLNGASLQLTYAGDIPTFTITRQRYSSIQTILMYQSGIRLESVQGPPKADQALQKSAQAAGEASDAMNGAEVSGGEKAGGTQGGDNQGGGTDTKSMRKGAAPTAKRRVRGREYEPVLAAVCLPAPRATAAKLQEQKGAAFAKSSGFHDVSLAVLPAKTTAAPQRTGELAAEPVVKTAAKSRAIHKTAAKSVVKPEKVPKKRGKLRAAVEDDNEGSDSPNAAPPLSAQGGAAGAKGLSPQGAATPNAASGSSDGGSGASGEGMAAPDRGSSASMGLDPTTGIAVTYQPPRSAAPHEMTLGPSGIKLASGTGNTACSIEQAAGVITVRCREFRVEADKIELDTTESTKLKSQGSLSLESALDLTLKTAAKLGLQAEAEATLKALTVLMDALNAIAMQGTAGGIGLLGNGPGVQIYGSNVACTGLHTTMSGVTTRVHGASVNMGHPESSGAPGPIPDLTPGHLEELAHRLTNPIPLVEKQQLDIPEVPQAPQGPTPAAARATRIRPARKGKPE